MRHRIARLLVALYPRGFRTQYGDELGDLIVVRPLTALVVADLLRGALVQHVRLRSAAFAWFVGGAAFMAGQLVSLSAGVTANVLWPPTTAARTLMFAATFGPLAAAALRSRQLRRAI